MSVESLEKLKNVAKVKAGDTVVLRDFHTLEATGDEFSAEIKDVSKWSFNGMTVYGAEIEVDDETTLMLMVRDITEDVKDYRLFRLWDRTIASEAGDFISIESGTFQDFEVSFEEDSVDSFETKAPFPFWDAKKSDGKQVSICEFANVSEDVGEMYWATHSFVEWYAFVGDNGSDGLTSLWFGWDIGKDDFDFITD
jgi:hypothetical protein